MGHLTNPISLRLSNSRVWNSCWGFFRIQSYRKLYLEDLQLNTFLNFFFAYKWFTFPQVTSETKNMENINHQLYSNKFKFDSSNISLFCEKLLIDLIFLSSQLFMILFRYFRSVSTLYKFVKEKLYSAKYFFEFFRTYAFTSLTSKSLLCFEPSKPVKKVVLSLLRRRWNQSKHFYRNFKRVKQIPLLSSYVVLKQRSNVYVAIVLYYGLDFYIPNGKRRRSIKYGLPALAGWSRMFSVRKPWLKAGARGRRRVSLIKNILFSLRRRTFLFSFNLLYFINMVYDNFHFFLRNIILIGLRKFGQISSSIRVDKLLDFCLVSNIFSELRQVFFRLVDYRQFYSLECFLYFCFSSRGVMSELFTQIKQYHVVNISTLFDKFLKGGLGRFKKMRIFVSFMKKWFGSVKNIHDINRYKYSIFISGVRKNKQFWLLKKKRKFFSKKYTFVSTSNHLFPLLFSGSNVENNKRYVSFLQKLHPEYSLKNLRYVFRKSVFNKLSKQFRRARNKNSLFIVKKLSVLYYQHFVRNFLITKVFLLETLKNMRYFTSWKEEDKMDLMRKLEINRFDVLHKTLNRFLGNTVFKGYSSFKRYMQVDLVRKKSDFYKYVFWEMMRKRYLTWRCWNYKSIKDLVLQRIFRLKRKFKMKKKRKLRKLLCRVAKQRLLRSIAYSIFSSKKTGLRYKLYVGSLGEIIKIDLMRKGVKKLPAKIYPSKVNKLRLRPLIIKSLVKRFRLKYHFQVVGFRGKRRILKKVYLKTKKLRVPSKKHLHFKKAILKSVKININEEKGKII